MTKCTAEKQKGYRTKPVLEQSSERERQGVRVQGRWDLRSLLVWPSARTDSHLPMKSGRLETYRRLAHAAALPSAHLDVA